MPVNCTVNNEVELQEQILQCANEMKSDPSMISRAFIYDDFMCNLTPLLRQQNKITEKSLFNLWSPTHRDEMVTFLTLPIT